MRFLELERTYESTCNIEEFRARVQGHLNKKRFLGLLTNHGKLTDTTFEIKGFNYTRFGGPSPRLFGKYEANGNKTQIQLTFSPSNFSYIMEGFALIIISILIFNPNTQINNQPSAFHERALFGLLFILFWTGALILLSYIFFNTSEKRTINELDMKLVQKKTDNMV